MADDLSRSDEIKRAFVEYDREVIRRNIKVGCVIGIVLMPAGVILDVFNYPAKVWHFLTLRLLCSVLIGFFWIIVASPFGRKHPRKLGVLLAMFPTFFMSWMIYEEGGAESHYYAGLNLVLLVIGFVLYWTFFESLVAVVLVISMYLAACFLPPNGGSVAGVETNLYFLTLTGIIVMTGSYFHSKYRFSEFALRYRLDKSNEDLAEAIEQLRTTQDQLVESEKKRALGVLAGGIIHDIGNTLNHINTNVFVLRKRCSRVNPEQQESLLSLTADLDKGVKQALSTVQRVRQYTHPNTEMLEQVEVGDVVESALLFTGSRWKEAGVKVELDIVPGQTIWANKHNLVDVLANLILNSVDALRVKPGAAPVESPTIQIKGRIENGKSVVRVRDNGCGIKPEDIARVFDPYFTTKDVGEGTGLGLSTCQRVVRQYGGEITVNSEVGKFCEFTLEFPSKP